MSTTLHPHWKEKASPARLERRFEFVGYDETRVFLDQAAALSGSMEVYPDMSFGRTYVNMTLYLDEGGSGGKAAEYAHALDGFTAEAAA
jgi:pterin-4a-carbinolamine dehydratase